MYYRLTDVTVFKKNRMIARALIKAPTGGNPNFKTDRPQPGSITLYAKEKDVGKTGD